MGGKKGKALKIGKVLFAIWAVDAFLAYLSPMLGLEKDFLSAMSYMAMISASLFALVLFTGLLIRNFWSPNGKPLGEKIVSLSCRNAILILAASLLAVLGSDVIARGEWHLIPGIFLGFGRVFWGILCAGGLLLSCWVTGRKVSAVVFGNKVADEPIFGLATGLCLYSFVFLGLGFIGAYYSWVAWAIVGANLLAFYKGFREAIRKLSGKPLRIVMAWDRILSFNGLAWLILGLILVGMLFSASANLLSGASDTFHQYLTFPTQYVENHGIVEFRYHPHFGFPQLAEMIYAWSILLGGTPIPFVTAYLILLACFVALWKIISERENGKSSFVWVALMLISVPFMFGFGMGYLKVEPFLLLYVLAAFLAIRKCLNDGDSGFAMASFFFLAVSLDVKYTGAFVIASAFVAFVAMRGSFSFSWKRAIIFGTISLAVFLPWALKDIHYYGNPIYPILNGSDYVSERTGLFCQPEFVRNSKEDMYVNYEGMDHFFDGNYAKDNLDLLIKKAFAGWSANALDIGPWASMFLPLLAIWIVASKDKFIRFLSIFLACYLACWIFFMAGQPWYLLPAMAAFVVILADMLGGNRSFAIGNVSKAIVIIWALWEMQLFFLFGYFPEKLSLIRGERDFFGIISDINAKNSKDRRENFMEVDRYINSKIIRDDPDAVVLGFEDMEDGYFVRDSYRRFIPDLFGFTFSCLSRNGDAYGELKRIGVRYFIVDSRYSPVCASENGQRKFAICRVEKEFEGFLMANGNVLFESGSLSLVELK